MGTIRTGEGRLLQATLLEINHAGCEVRSPGAGVQEDPRGLYQLQGWSENVRIFWGNPRLSQSQVYPPNTLRKPRLLLTGEFDLEKGRTVEREEKGTATSKRN